MGKPTEGFQFLNRLEEDWINNINRFNGEGEGYFKLQVNNQVVGVGGINNNPFDQAEKRVGRIRRFFILKQWRNRGLGSELLSHIIKEFSSAYETIQLKTDNRNACLFYEKYGFNIIDNDENVTHELKLRK